MRRRFSCVLFLCILAPILALENSLNNEVLGLIVFKADINDPSKKLSGWNEDDESPCNWFGIKCNPKSHKVTELILDGLNLSGKLSKGLLQLSSLSKLSLSKNNLTGPFNLSFTHFPNLRILDLSENRLSGEISSDLFQQNGVLRSISLAKNNFSGSIPKSLTSCLTLGSLNLSYNQFSGSLPSGLWSLAELMSLDLSDNLLEGEIPKDISRLKNLRDLILRNNRFSGTLPNEIGTLNLLKSIDLSENSFLGVLPSSIQKLKLCTNLNLSKNRFYGELTDWIGEITSLETLDLSRNNFSGAISESIQNLRSLKIINLSGNFFTGDLPSWVFNLTLEQIKFSENWFFGSLDNAFALLNDNSTQKLLVLDLAHNMLNGSIPSNISEFINLRVINLTGNSLIGKIPNSIGELKSLESLDLSQNRLISNIPRVIGNCSSLKSLNLSRNQLNGVIPRELANITNIENVDLSFNKLTGGLPKELANLINLLTFNISHNQLNGKLPGGNFFNTISSSSISDNPLICGAIANRSCPNLAPKPLVMNPNITDPKSGSSSQDDNMKRKLKLLSVSVFIAIGAACLIFVGVLTVMVLNLSVKSTATRSSFAPAMSFSGGDDSSRSCSPSTDSDSGKLVMFSSKRGFSSNTRAHALLTKDREIGRGGFGAVYHAVLNDGYPVAIKKLTVTSMVKSLEDFEVEVKKLGEVRHENLVRLEGYYWTSTLQLLINEYVSGGNLYKYLHEGEGFTWDERFGIILGIGKGISFLHKMGIIHYNVKSSNVLIGKNGEAKVTDYGLARLLPMIDRYVLSSKIQSALGYTAPELTCKTVKITEKCDVYGFGVLVLEIVTGKRPVEYMEDDVVVLSDLVRGVLEEGRVVECVDKRLNGKFPAEEMVPVVKLGLICTSQVPSNRPSMDEVVNILELIRGGSSDVEN